MARGLRSHSRIQLRFAAVLIASFAVSLAIPAAGLAFNVVLLTAGAASAALALATCFPKAPPPWLSATVLAAGCALGMIASLAAMPLLALIFAGGASGYILAAGISRMKVNPISGLGAMLGGISLLLGGLAVMDSGLGEAALFFAAALGLVARALQKPVEDADARVELLIGR